MKLIIAGSRTLNPSTAFLEECITQARLKPEEIVSGGAMGVDLAAKVLTMRNTPSYLSLKLLDKYKEFPADWDKHGKAAGHIRNAEMAHYADALLLIWDGESRGSSNMLYKMKQLGKPVYEVILKTHNV